MLRVLPAVLIAGCSFPLVAQTAWFDRSFEPGYRSSVQLAYDSQRGRVVLFGGRTTTELFITPPRGDTWEWDGQRWHRMNPRHSPSPRTGHAMAFDSARGRVILYGGQGRSGAGLDDTWTWDGIDWQQVTTPATAGFRYEHGMVYDAARDRMVVFGGYSGFGSGRALGAESHLFDGTTWFRGPVGPAPRIGHAVGYDPASSRVFVTAGWNPQTPALFDDTWVLDGVGWSLAAATGLGSRRDHAMVFDAGRGRLLSIGGVLDSRTMEWTGTGWSPVSEITPPPANMPGVPTAFDDRRGELIYYTNRAMWVWNVPNWEQRGRDGPPPRREARLCYHDARSLLVMFGCDLFPVCTDHSTWLRYPDGRWLRATGAAMPAVTRGFDLAYDAARQRIVLYGGSTDSGLIGDTWTFDGVVWERGSPGVTPPPRASHTMAYDAARQRVVMFGGVRLGAPLDETWEWDGADWTHRTDHTSRPPARRWHGMAYDPSLERVVMCSGLDRRGYRIPDTWTWDGSSWTLLPTRTRPSGVGTMAYDKARQRMVLTLDDATGGRAVWEMIDGDWVARPDWPPHGSFGFGLAYDAAAERTVLFVTGTHGEDDANEVWEYGPLFAARLHGLGAGCQGSAGVPLLDAIDDRRPWTGTTLNLRVGGVPTSPGSCAFGFVGFSDRRYRDLLLPLDLGPIGMPGCTLFTSLDIGYGLTANGGWAPFDIVVPDDPTSLGLRFFAQAAVLDPTANVFGLVLSNAIVGTIGGL